MKRARVFGAVVAMGLWATGAIAAEYPTRPITLLHGYAPGGSADTIARLVAKPLSERLGQAVVVDPKPGAGGNLAAAAIARAEPDGYTIGLVTGGHAVAKGLYKSLAFDPVDSFEMVSNIVEYNFVLAVRTDHPAKTLQELLTIAKQAPGSVKYGSAGIGTTHHLTGELLNKVAGVQMAHIPYKGEAAAITSVLNGEIPLIIASPVTIAPQIRAGKLRALAVTSDRRWDGLPDVPTVAEAGLKDFNVSTWAGIVAPKGTPPAIIARLNSEIAKLVADPEVKARIEGAVGGEIHTSTPAEMRARVAAETTRWVGVIKEAGIAQQ
ncbi:Bug family tripartite tricarboxylate transporter substrate binding protein [Chelatococcus asaccharovorans]|uniref:Bug family tripartite tricarboxylate transporter substrate binding protein n=1 Tax=Chelatococcus asaccharovorans TaxID=28210 RepID=UPI00224C758B|nr:tripartite tricarboxylate transporter substrate binding protein [Chelatococcus asaccharovorans]CAH1651580.1 Tripartite-type tricarboxylate transporter receptor subunit TctC [Chelatococcus asaccharovorans]CAH1686581.1 Tripartite-type tricarboxylate transporter receptor subunit TctC [Chelatococcus asaccharovorans]